MKRLALTVIAFFAASSVAFAKLDVNTATQAELEAIKDLGAVKAKAIIDYREKHGAFKVIKDLEKVPGLDATTVKKIRHDVIVQEPEYMRKNRIHKHPKN